MVTQSRFILWFQALACDRTCLIEGMRRLPRHLRLNRLISISAWFSRPLSARYQVTVNIGGQTFYDLSTYSRLLAHLQLVAVKI
jgi:hypothetical protein